MASPKRVSLLDCFSEPSTYKPPVLLEDLRLNTEYPNMNSIEYRLSNNLYQVPDILHPCYEIIIQNDLGNVIIAGNNYTSRKWCSSFYSWENTDNLGDDTKVVFKRQCDYGITAMDYIDSTFFLVANDKGSLELWSTKSDVRGSGYCLFMVGQQNEHISGISSLEIFKTNNKKGVTGSNDGCLKIWDTGVADLYSMITMSHAHGDEVTAISSSHQLDSTFVTCSSDKSALVWDIRLPCPASCLVEQHKYAFTDIYWTSSTENNELVVLGDETGKIHFVDTRQPDVILETINVFDRGVHKIKYNGKHFAVIGNTQTLKVFDEKSEVIFENCEAPNYVRDLLWSGLGKNQFSAIGWDSFLKDFKF